MFYMYVDHSLISLLSTWNAANDTEVEFYLILLFKI